MMNGSDRRHPEHPGEHDGMYNQGFSVPFEYPVYFTRGALDGGNELLADTLDRLDEGRRHRAAVYIDAGVALAHPDLANRFKEYFHDREKRIELAASPEILQAGETVKNNWNTVRDVMFTLGNLHLDRQSFVIAVGGGSLLDMLGFATSIVHRGLRLVRLPSTTLAQNDAGVSVKNGMNEHRQKNFVGTFAPPFAVINDFDFLRTLDQTHWIGGVAEAFKVALIKDGAFFDYLCEKADDLAARNEAVLEQVIRRCAILHLDHIKNNGDPFEFGSARPLDFGHWAGHKLEVLTDYRLGHGQCVAVGIALDAHYAMRQGLLEKKDHERLMDAMLRCGLPVYTRELTQRKADGTLMILEGLLEFKEHLGGNLNVTLPDGVGRKREVHQMNPQLIEEGVAFLQGFS